MKLNYRENFELITGLGIVCPISIQGKPVSLVLDTWSEGLVNLTEKISIHGAHNIPKEPTKKFPMDIKKRLKKRKASSYLKPCL